MEAEHNVSIAAPYLSTDVFENGILGAAMTAALERKVIVERLTTKENLERPRIESLFANFGPYLRLFSPEFREFESSKLGSHAKFCICDDTAAYVGSANLTTPGLGEHFELGVLVRGQAASAMRSFWNFSVCHDLFSPFASSPRAK